MASVAELDLPRFDTMTADVRGPAFHEAMLALRESGSWLAAGPLAYTVLDRESGEFFLRSKATVFPGLRIAELFGIDDGPLYDEMVRNIINVNGDDHRRLRSLLNPALTPKAAERHRAGMRRIIGEILDGLPADGRIDFVDVAWRYPSLVIADLVGVPLEMAPKLYEWSSWIQKQFDPGALATERAEIEQRVVEFHEYAGGLIADRRANPGDDLTSALILARDGSDRLDDDELVNLVLDVILGGIDTAQSQLSHAVRLLAEHPEQWEALRADPRGLAPSAVDEAFRYEPVTPFTARLTTEEVEHRDVTFPPDTLVAISSWHANRDGDEAADRFDISDRKRPRVLTFGAGIHYCVGANLARAELEEALVALTERYERIELDGEPEYGSISGIYGIDRLPVRLVV